MSLTLQAYIRSKFYSLTRIPQPIPRVYTGGLTSTQAGS